MILKESIRYDDPLLKLFRGNKKILVQDIHDEADDFRFWAGFLLKLGASEEEIEKIFSNVVSADQVAEYIYDTYGDTHVYQAQFAESIELSENEHLFDDDDEAAVVLVVYEDENERYEYASDYQAEAHYAELEQMHEQELKSEGILGFVLFERNEDHQFVVVDRFIADPIDEGIVETSISDFLDNNNEGELSLKGQMAKEPQPDPLDVDESLKEGVGNNRLIWDDCTPTMDRRPTTEEDIEADIHVEDFDTPEEMLNTLLDLANYDEEDLLDFYDSEEDYKNASVKDKIERVLGCFEDPGDGSPNILFAMVESEELDAYPYDCLDSLNLATCSDSDVIEAIKADYDFEDGDDEDIDESKEHHNEVLKEDDEADYFNGEDTSSDHLYGVAAWFNMKGQYDIYYFDNEGRAKAFAEEWKAIYDQELANYDEYIKQGMSEMEIGDKLTDLQQALCNKYSDCSYEDGCWGKDFKEVDGVDYYDNIEIVDYVDYGY